MISSLAQIHPNARIGNNVTIEPFCVIYENVEIDEGTVIMPHVTILSGARIGKNCKIFPGAVVGAIPQDLKFVGEETTAVIGDYTTIRECVTVNRGTIDKRTTKVGSHCLIMAYAHVAHDCLLGDHVILANGVQLAGHVQVDDYAIIGGLTGAHQFTRVGAHSYTAANTLIRKDIPPFVKAAREPMSYAGVNIVGLQRRGYSKDVIEEISKIYHILFVQGHSTSKALELIESSLPDSSVRREILSFVKDSEIGIIKRSKDGMDANLAF